MSPNALWLADIRAGFLVSLIALPLCLGIATASGFPPVAGLITAIIGGIFVSALGGAPCAIKGPAAGLIVIVLAAVLELGQGDMVLGYRQTLAVGVAAGVLQLCFALLRIAGLGIAMSRTVVHGMLAAIGVMIIAKQAHIVLGVEPEANGTFGLIAEWPHSLAELNLAASLIGFMSLVLLICWPRIPSRFTRSIPASLIVLIGAMICSLALNLSEDGAVQLFGHMVATGSHLTIALPDSLLSALTFPDFSALMSLTSLKYILMFALVGTIESTLSVIAVDNLRDDATPAPLDRDLAAIAVGNIIASMLGGLPMISEIVRSKANIDAGATSVRANAVHGLCLLVYLALLSELMSLIPLSALAAMLVITGARLASPSELRHAKQLGMDQFMLLLTTIAVTLATDLLMGVASGLALKLVIHAWRGAFPWHLWRASMHIEPHADEQHIIVKGSAAFTALISLRKALAHIKQPDALVVVDVSDATVVDHTFLSGMPVLFRSYPAMRWRIKGLEQMQPVGNHPHAAHIRAKS